ncbi:MAG: caspase family protein [Catenulispora sp.]|nr:caspase family protein [Catenulispora sp.]
MRDPLSEATIPAREASGAVLIGVGTYRSLPELPSALNGIADLAAALGGPDGVFAPEAVHPVADPESATEVLDRVAEAADRYSDTVVCYFAGHGIRDTDGRLCLALPWSLDKKSEAERTALPVERIMAVLRGSRAKRRIAILDCRYAGRAMRAPSAFNVHLLTACGQNEKLPPPAGQRTTPFTGALLDLLRNGVPGAGRWLTLGDLYRWIGGSADDPTPHQRAVDDSAAIAVAPNRADRHDLGRRAALATRVGGKDPARAARLFADLVIDAAARAEAKEALAYRMSAASWLGAAGDPAGALARWEAIRHDPHADPMEVDANIAYWRRARAAHRRRGVEPHRGTAVSV